MVDVTEEIKKDQYLLKQLKKVQEAIKKQEEKIINARKEFWTCSCCKHRFTKPRNLDKNNQASFWKIPLDKDIEFVPKGTKMFSEWTISGYDFYEAKVSDVYIVCPNCGARKKQYTQRMEEGVYKDSKDSW